MQNIHIGDPYRFTPSAFVGEKDAERNGARFPRELTGRVVYIHPERRFYMVEAKLHGFPLRECFKMK